MGVIIKVSALYNHQSNPVVRFHKTKWNLLRAKLANGVRDWESSLPAIELAYNSNMHASTGCFLGRDVELPHLSLSPNFQDSDQQQEP